jgi:phosphatidylglycerophosphatase C
VGAEHPEANDDGAASPSAARLPSPPDLTGRPGVAAFDFDGTLVDRDSLIPFLARLTDGAGRERSHRHWAEARLLWSTWPAMLSAYRQGGRDQAKVALLRQTVAGLPADVVAHAGTAFGRELAGRLRPDMAARLAWHRSAGHHTVIISASLDLYLDAFAGATGFDQVLATTLEVDATGRLTGQIRGANVRGPEKASRLRALLASLSANPPYEPPELWVYGDSAGDDDMLALADHPLRVSHGVTRLRHAIGALIEGRARRPGARART